MGKARVIFKLRSLKGRNISADIFIIFKEVGHKAKHAPAHVEDEGEGVGTCHSKEDDWQNDEAMDNKADHHSEEVHAQLGQLAAQVLRGEDLPSDEEADTNWCEVDDPGSQLNSKQIKTMETLIKFLTSTNLHHDHREASEESQHWQSWSRTILRVAVVGT